MNFRAILRQACAGFAVIATSQSSYSLQLTVPQGDINLRMASDDTSELSLVGHLAAGSTISIPDTYVVPPRGSNDPNAIDWDLTLAKWQASAGASTGLRTFNGGKRDFFFPVKIKYAAPGSNVPAGVDHPRAVG